MHVERLAAIALLTDASGDCVAYSAKPVTGRILAVKYTKTDFTDGVDITLTGEGTGLPIIAWVDVNATALAYPRQPVHDAAGVAATLDGTRAMRDYPFVVAERIKVVVAQGGNAKAGSITVYIG